MERKRSVGATIFILLSLLLIAALLLAIYFYTSPFKIFPWYDESFRGFQILGVFIFVVPLLLFISMGFYIIGRYYNINKFLKNIPLFVMLGLFVPYVMSTVIQTVALPFVINKESDAIKGINIFASNLSFTFGALIGVGFLIVSIKMIIKNLTSPVPR